MPCPYGKPGDIHYARETFYAYGYWCLLDGKWKFNDESLQYDGHRFMDNPPHSINESRGDGIGWYKRPSIFIPKPAARIWDEVVSIKVERLQDITEQDAIAEGVIENEDGTYYNYFTQKGLRYQDGVECLLAKGSFQSLWCSINGLDSWAHNPWLWCVETKSLSTTGKPESLCHSQQK